MFCIIVYGTRLSGSVDYFTFENETYFVHTMFGHWCFCPITPRESFISKVKFPNTYLVRLPTTVGRSILWAWLRVLSIILPFIAAAVAGFMKHIESERSVMTEGFTDTGTSEPLFDNINNILMWFFAALSLLLVFLSVALFVYRPKASPEKIQEYTQLLSNAFMASRCPHLVVSPASQIIVRTTTTSQYRPMNNEAPPPYVVWIISLLIY